ncbi:MAG TPA: polysaccharide deacetylase family protein [Acidimicrobiia bacterium]|nr:polysaccharide deacetylase family protein [Acidimicrobiia bacterium]
MDNRRGIAVVAAVLVVAGMFAAFAGRGSSNGGFGTANAVPVPKSLAADNASPHEKLAVAPKRVPARVPSGAYQLLPAPPATPVQLPGAGSALAPVVSRLPITDKVIFLGIDDGLVRDPQVLTLLKRAKVPFTMFLVQGAADAGEAYWQQAQQAGGTVEAHTITHPDLTKVGEQRRHDEVCGPIADLQERFGRRPTLFRPPYGAYNDAVRADAASCGFKAVVMWKGSTNDGRFDLQEGPNLQPGDIILMHWRTDLYQDLLKVFDTVRTQGFSIGRLEDYFPDPATTATAPRAAKSSAKK